MVKKRKSIPKAILKAIFGTNLNAIFGNESTMERIGTFIANNVAKNSNEKIQYSTMECGREMDMEIEDMCYELYDVIRISKISELTVFPENYGTQRKTIISFKYDGRKCEIGELFGTQRDYFWVNMFPVEN